MIDPDYQEGATALARQWQGLIVPVEDENAADLRRKRVVSAVGGAIERSSARRAQERRIRRIFTGFSLAAGVMLAAGLGHYAHRAPAHSTTAMVTSGPALGGVRATSGVVTLMHGSHPTILDHATLEVGDSLSTAAGGTAELRLTDLVVASIAGSSDVSVILPRNATHRLRLDRGRLDAHVDDRPSSTPKLVVETPDVEVVVTGTAFEVDVTRPPGSAVSFTEVSVTKGRVVVRRGGAAVAAVSAGQSWTSAVTAAIGATGATDEAARVERDHVGAAAGATPVAPARSGTLADENKLYQSAVEARNHGDDHGAVDQLGALLGKYPGSPLAGEARVERMRALQRLGQPLDAAREARRYLAEYPEGFARDEARRLVMQDGTSGSSANLPQP